MGNVAYSFYLNKVLLPVTPSKLTVKIKNQNKTVTLINDGEINILKSAGLTEISFDCVIPQSRYPFATYQYGEPYAASYYIDHFEKMKQLEKGFRFVVIRSLTSPEMFDTNMKVSLEDYSITEDASKNGCDLVISVKLKQYVKVKTVKVEIKKKKKKKKKVRDSDRTLKKPVKYKTKKGDTLWKLAKKNYGTGDKYLQIYNANKKLCTSKKKPKVGVTITIPAEKKGSA